MNEPRGAAGRPCLLAGGGAPEGLRVQATAFPAPDSTLCGLSSATRVLGPAHFPETLLVQPVAPGALTGLDPVSLRVFRFDGRARSFQMIGSSGVNVALGYVWAKVTRPGIYCTVGLPRDRLLGELLLGVAIKTRQTDPGGDEDVAQITRLGLQPLLESPAEQIEEVRRLITTLEARTTRAVLLPGDVRPGKGGHLQPFPFPRDASLEELRERLSRLRVPPGGLPEVALLNEPMPLAGHLPPWPTLPGGMELSARVDATGLQDLEVWDRLSDAFPWWPPLPWLFSQNWWMYHHDRSHSGHASGLSGITSSTVHRMHLHAAVPLPDGGRVFTIPSIVDGKIYVGTVNAAAGGGSLYRIDLLSGTVDMPPSPYPSAPRSPAYDEGIGGSPAVWGGNVYFTDIPGRVYCIDASTFTLRWQTDLRQQDLTHKQPVQNPDADCWASPVVANGSVYVGCGEGERGAFGFVYCLDACSGDVKWLFSTTVFPGVADNSPNVIPQSAAGGLSAAQLAALGPGFTTLPDPPTGASVWSSCAYDHELNRIYVGTGNSNGPAAPGAIDGRYGSGVIALDATTGSFEGFFQPDPADGYYPGDSDVDVPASPTLYWLNGRRVLAIGSKSGAFFILDAQTLTPVTTPRQLLPRTGGDGFRGDGSQPVASVDPGGKTGGENMYGVFGTAAVDYACGRLYVGLGGYSHAIDSATTPFLRALRWDDLTDAWATALGNDGVRRYTAPAPPMYANPGEAGLSSPAVVNDVLFVSTGLRRLYALDTATGLCLWSAPGIAGGPLNWDTCIMGPAIYGDFVVIGSESVIYIYRLGRHCHWPWQ